MVIFRTIAKISQIHCRGILIWATLLYSKTVFKFFASLCGLDSTNSPPWKCLRAETYTYCDRVSPAMQMSPTPLQSLSRYAKVSVVGVIRSPPRQTLPPRNELTFHVWSLMLPCRPVSTPVSLFRDLSVVAVRDISTLKYELHWSWNQWHLFLTLPVTCHRLTKANYCWHCCS